MTSDGEINSAQSSGRGESVANRQAGNGKAVAVDVMGGDHGAAVVIEGAVAAAREHGTPVTLVGDTKQITPILKELQADSIPDDSAAISTVHAEQVITMEDSPTVAIRGKERSSVRIAFELVCRGEACAVVSPGNTGAVMAAGRFLSGSLPGIGRPAIATLIPRVGGKPPVVLLDSGANIDCHAEQLVQFALMGSYYAFSATGTETPRVALLSNGTESSKGNDITRAAALTLEQMPEINFVGYVEGRHIAKDCADVVVCDGFIGNIVLKTVEGAVELVFDSMRHYVEKSVRGKLGLWLAKPLFHLLFRDKLDPSSYGGAPLLGLNHIAIVCHGSAHSKAITNGVRVARQFAEDGLVGRMREALGELDLDAGGVYEDGIWGRMGERFEKKGKQVKKQIAPEKEPVNQKEGS